MQEVAGSTPAFSTTIEAFHVVKGFFYCPLQSCMFQTKKNKSRGLYVCKASLLQVQVILLSNQPLFFPCDLSNPLPYLYSLSSLSWLLAPAQKKKLLWSKLHPIHGHKKLRQRHLPQRKAARKHRKKYLPQKRTAQKSRQMAAIALQSPLPSGAASPWASK